MTILPVFASDFATYLANYCVRLTACTRKQKKQMGQPLRLKTCSRSTGGGCALEGCRSAPAAACRSPSSMPVDVSRARWACGTPLLQHAPPHRGLLRRFSARTQCTCRGKCICVMTGSGRFESPCAGTVLSAMLSAVIRRKYGSSLHKGSVLHCEFGRSQSET